MGPGGGETTTTFVLRDIHHDPTFSCSFFRRVPIVTTMRLPTNYGNRATNRHIIWTMLVFQTSNNPSTRSTKPRGQRNNFRRLPLRTITPPIQISGNTINVNPIIPLNLQSTRGNHVIIFTLPAMPRSRVNPRPLSVRRTRARVIYGVNYSIFLYIKRRLLQIQRDNPRLVLRHMGHNNIHQTTPARHGKGYNKLATRFIRRGFRFRSPPGWGRAFFQVPMRLPFRVVSSCIVVGAEGFIRWGFKITKRFFKGSEQRLPTHRPRSAACREFRLFICPSKQNHRR